MPNSRSKFVKLIYLFFFLSGFCGLIYQVLWAKYFGNIFGSSAYAHTTVLATFMGGLALGNFVLGRFADRTRLNLLCLYGLIEIGIGLYCIIYPNIVLGIETIYKTVGWKLNLVSMNKGLLALQFFLSSTSILIPTFLMGGTLPIMAKFITHTRHELMNRVSMLYFINSIGAVLGALVGGFYCIRLWGLDASIAVAAVINIAIGLMSLWIAKSFKDPVNKSNVDGNSQEFNSEYTEVQQRIIFISIGLSGFASMLYEIMWIRTLIQFMGSSVYSFSIVVAAFITGISLGSAFLINRQKQLGNLYFFYGFVQVMIALTMYFCVSSINLYTEWIWTVQQIFQPKAFVYPIFLFLNFLCVFAMLIIPTFFIGMTLPLASSICTQDLRILGRGVGGVFSSNTIGCLLGTVVAGLIFLPHFGTQKSFLIGIIINWFIGIAVILSLRKAEFRKWALVSIAALLFFHVIFPFNINKSLSLNSMFRIRNADGNLTFHQHVKRNQEKKILFFKEDFDANVAITLTGDMTSLYINGKADASSKLDMPTQLLSGHLPALLHQHPKKVLIIGFGSGVTVGALTRYPSIERIDCLEISPAVIEAGKFFSDVNEQCLLNKKVRIIIDDAKNFLTLNKEKYDLIISEPTNPWTAGTASLMTIETFENMKRSLNDDGLILQWFHAYEMSNEIFNVLGATFTEVFEYVSVWRPVAGDCFFMASLKPPAVNLEQLKEQMSFPDVKKSLKRIKIEDVYALLATQIFSEKMTRRIFYRAAAINSNQYPLIEFNAPRTFFLGQFVTMLEQKDERFQKRSGSDLYISLYLDKYFNNVEDLKSAYTYFKLNHPALFDRLVNHYVDDFLLIFNGDWKEKMFLEKIKLNRMSTELMIEKWLNLNQKEPANYDIFEQLVFWKMKNFNHKFSIFSENDSEVISIENVLNEGAIRFPMKKDKIRLKLAKFYETIGADDKAFEEYFNIANGVSSDSKDDLSKSALLSGLFLSIDLKDKIMFERMKTLVSQRFSNQPDINSIVNKGNIVFRKYYR